jgi:large subunit ribosomal protein L15
MQLHKLKPTHKLKKKKRVGRGGKRGTYAGRGIKGQKTRSGWKLKPAIRESIKRYPKLRGYRVKSRKEKPFTLNLDLLEKKFKSGDLVSPSTLLEKKLISKMKGRLPSVKILSRGKLTKKLKFKDCQFSKKAREEIEKAGGTIV